MKQKKTIDVIMAENFLKIMTDTKLQIQEAQRMPSSIIYQSQNQNLISPKHRYVIKYRKINKILEEAR